MVAAERGLLSDVEHENAHSLSDKVSVGNTRLEVGCVHRSEATRQLAPSSG